MKTFTIKQLEWEQPSNNTFQSRLGLGYVADVTNFDARHKDWRFSIYFEEDCYYELSESSDSGKYNSPSEAIIACTTKWREILLSILEEVKE